MNAICTVKPTIIDNGEGFVRSNNLPCVHYWICDSPENGFTKAQCRYCGETRLWETLGSKLARQEDRKYDWNGEIEEEDITGQEEWGIEHLGQSYKQDYNVLPYSIQY